MSNIGKFDLPDYCFCLFGQQRCGPEAVLSRVSKKLTYLKVAAESVNSWIEQNPTALYGAAVYIRVQNISLQEISMKKEMLSILMDAYHVMIYI